jgi:signal transduction histidine kinase
MKINHISIEQLEKEINNKDEEIKVLKNIIAEKDRIINRLKDSDKNFRVSLKDSPFIIAHVDQDLRYTWLYNPHCDFEEDESIGKRDDELSLNEGTLQLMELKRRVLETGERQNKEISFPLSDGILTYNVNGRPLKDGNGKVIGVVTASSDITDVKYKEKHLKENKEILRGILESTTDGILALSGDFKIIHSNEYFYKIWNIPDSLSIENDARAFVEHFKNQLTATDEFIPKIFSITESSVRNTDYLYLKDGKVIEYVYNPLVLEQKVSGAIWNFRDVTECKKIIALEQSLLEKTQIIEEANKYNKLKSQICSMVSHELKTPLNIILGSIQLIEKYQVNKPNCIQCCPFYRYLNAMKQNCYRLIRLIDNFVDLNRIEGGFLNINLKNTDIIKVVEDITLSIVEYTNSKSIDLIFDTEIEEKSIACDVEKLERIMLNLLSNAIKFTESGGSIEVNISEYEESLIISVKDTGTGIPIHMKDKIFETFTQVDHLYRRKAEGSGIGLSIVKSFVEMHGGKVVVESEYGKGSNFIIELPIKLADEEYVFEKEDILGQSRVEKITIEFSDIYALSTNN